MKDTPQTLMSFDRKNYTDELLIHLYRELVKPRLFEEKMLILLRQGKISKWFSGIGQEAISIGCTLALEATDYIFPMHRNLGVFTARGMDLFQLFSQFQGKMTGFSKGRERSFHFGSKEHHIVGMISHLGPQLSLANGVALHDKIHHHKGVSLAFTGDGATSQGEFHEALNVAAVWSLPTIFMIENNGYGLSTPNSEQYKCKDLIDKGIGYGIEAIQIDGNNLLEVYTTIHKYADELRYNPRPILIEAMTFRMRGHEEASGTKYIPPHLFEEWATKDPVGNFESYLLNTKVMTPKMIADFKDGFKKHLNEQIDRAFNEPMPEPSTELELADVYAPFTQIVKYPQQGGESEKRFIDAITDGLHQSLERHKDLIIMGQDIAEYGGAFKITQGFVEKFGKERIRNTPLCESAIVGAGLGFSFKGGKSVIEMQFADFVTCGFNQIINNLAKMYWRWGQNADWLFVCQQAQAFPLAPFIRNPTKHGFFTHQG